jgi:hypothetical protein
MTTHYQERPIEDEQLSGEVMSETTLRIRELNDAVRAADTAIGALLANGQLVITRGVAERGNKFIDRAVEAVRCYRDFGPKITGTESMTLASSSSTA